MPDPSHPRALSDATRLTPLGDGRYEAALSSYFGVMGRPNGGYIHCLAAAAARAEVAHHSGHHDVVTAITTTYVSSPRGERATLVATVRRAGLSTAFAHVAVYDGEHLTSESVATLGSLPTESEPRYHDATPTELPPLDATRALPGMDGVDIRRAVDVRLDPALGRWWEGERSDRAEVRAWLRLDDTSGQRWDAASLLFASDCLPPATFPIGSTGWVPTLQLTTYVRARPATEWLRARQWCQVVDGNLADERCELFDERGRLVATSTQLMLCRFPEG